MRGAAAPPSTVRTVCHDGIMPSARGLRACSASEPWAVPRLPHRRQLDAYRRAVGRVDVGRRLGARRRRRRQRRRDREALAPRADARRVARRHPQRVLRARGQTRHLGHRAAHVRQLRGRRVGRPRLLGGGPRDRKVLVRVVAADGRRPRDAQLGALLRDDGEAKRRGEHDQRRRRRVVQDVGAAARVPRLPRHRALLRCRPQVRRAPRLCSGRWRGRRRRSRASTTTRGSRRTRSRCRRRRRPRARSPCTAARPPPRRTRERR